jgi:hypothetical protein
MFFSIWSWPGGFSITGVINSRGRFAFHIYPDLAAHLYPASIVFFRLNLLWMNSWLQGSLFSNHRAFFILFSRFTSVDFANSLLKGIPHFLELGPKYFVSNNLFFAGLVTAAIRRNEHCHQFYAIFFLFQTAIISFTIFYTLN